MIDRVLERLVGVPCEYISHDTRRRMRCASCGCVPRAAYTEIATWRGYIGRAIACASAYCRARCATIALARAWCMAPLIPHDPPPLTTEIELWRRSYGYGGLRNYTIPLVYALDV